MKGTDINMYKEVYLLLSNRISDAIEKIEEIVNMAEEAEVKEKLINIVEYLKESQCSAEEVVISNNESIN